MEQALAIDGHAPLPPTGDELSRAAKAVVLTPAGPEYRAGLDWRPRHPTGLLLRTKALGVCQSDVKEVAGLRPGPSQFGHELVGEVVAVWGDPVHPPGALLCLDPNVPLNRSSGFATLVAADGPPPELRRAFYRVPAADDLEPFIFAEPLACALHCVRNAACHLGRADLAGQHVAIIGAGIAGVLLAWAATLHGATVTLTNRSGDRLSALQGLGLGNYLTLRPITEQQPQYDVAVLGTRFIEPVTLEWSLRQVRDGGLIVPYGGTSATDGLEVGGRLLDPIRRQEQCVGAQWQEKALLIGGAYGTDPEAFSQALQALASSSRWPLERLIEARVSLEALPALLVEMVHTRRFGKTTVTC